MSSLALIAQPISEITACNVAEVFINAWITRWGVPLRYNRQGNNSKSHVFQLFQYFGVSPKALNFLPDRKRGDACAKKELSRQKKETCSLSAVTSEVTLKIFLAAGGRPMRSSLGGKLVNLSTSSSRHFYE